MKYRSMALAFIALGVTGCGPIVSGVQIINANIAVNAAHAAGAQQSAPYEYNAAQEYLKKAREENAYAEFWAAQLYAEKAVDYAVRARDKAARSDKATPAKSSAAAPGAAP